MSSIERFIYRLFLYVLLIFAVGLFGMLLFFYEDVMFIFYDLWSRVSGWLPIIGMTLTFWLGYRLGSGHFLGALPYMAPSLKQALQVQKEMAKLEQRRPAEVLPAKSVPEVPAFSEMFGTYRQQLRSGGFNYIGDEE